MLLSRAPCRNLRKGSGSASDLLLRGKLLSPTAAISSWTEAPPPVLPFTSSFPSGHRPPSHPTRKQPMTTPNKPPTTELEERATKIWSMVQAREGEAEDPAQSSEELEENARPRPHVLMVDDEADLCELVAL